MRILLHKVSLPLRIHLHIHLKGRLKRHLKRHLKIHTVVQLPSTSPVVTQADSHHKNYGMETTSDLLAQPLPILNRMGLTTYQTTG